MSAQIIEAKAAMDKERKIRMEFNTDSFDILIEFDSIDVKVAIGSKKSMNRNMD